MATCELCGEVLESEKEKERGVCRDCHTIGFWKLSEVIGKMRKKYGDLDQE